ncbi:hypothetical protein PR048_022360 [Dryococelus australis]|uniref:Uncharacterized protein n=1 Tax=Dryococelus australis TaxID=614101 RepID=A0ABQ9H0V8_9NEOP|nr:hypothetical protein PR048_022360 [Dryococelus australis]
MHDHFDSMSLTHFDTEGSIKSVLHNKLADLKGFEFAVFVTSTRNDWASSQEAKRRMSNYEENPIRTFVAKIIATVKVCTNRNCLGHRYVDIYSFLYFKHSLNQRCLAFPVTQTCLKFVVPKLERMPQYLNIILPFRKETCLLYFVGIPACYGCIDVTSRICCCDGSDQSRLSGSITVSVFIAITEYYCPLVMNAYTSSLTSYLTTPRYHPDSNTLEELRSFGRTIFGVPADEENSVDYFFSDSDTDNPLIQISLFFV